MTEKKDITEVIKGNPELQVELLKDMLDDAKKDRKRKHTLIVLLVVLLFAGFVYYQHSFKSFLSQYDFSTETGIETTANSSNNTTNNGSINIGK